jgi:hypothetical protein
MLHSLPALLDDLERRLITGEDPLPLLGSVRWSEISDWPKDPASARQLKSRLASIHALINGLQAPIQATLMALTDSAGYGARGTVSVPASVSLRFSEHV